MKKITALLLAAGTLSLFGASDIQTFGCGITKSAYLKKLNSAYAKKYNVKVSIPGRGGASKAILLAGTGKVAVGSGCRPVIDIPNDKGVVGTHVAWGALVFLVNPDNPMETVTVDQAKSISNHQVNPILKSKQV